ncbi:hypothetical protein ACSX1A_07080 [Pontibacter sp. MBLB2868]|uniref:hypothetical protein n=1 Tax=Pontibacter sp. MBLB2868 TaxID=3451555 RepID=UPI003F7530B2
MKPEDIDKLFRERVGNTSPTPPSDLWNRLQQRIEEELPQPNVIPLAAESKEEKKNFMWIYSSVAATLSLLLTVGIVFYNIKTIPEISEKIAVAEKPVLQETPVFTAPASETIAQVEPAQEKISEPQATVDATPASTTTETVAKPATIAKATKDVHQNKVTKASIAVQPKAYVQKAIASNTPTEKPVETATVVATDKPVTANALAGNTAASSANMNAEPVEIIIKRSAAPQTALAAAENEPSGFDKKTRLAKNIFKQVRNLANGEEVELQALGIRADKVALETQIGNKKLSKVINL